MPYLLLVLTTLFWSGNFVISRAMHLAIPPFALSFWRWMLALAILATFSWKPLSSQRHLVVRHFRYLAVQAVAGVAGFNSLVYLAMQSTTAINAVLVNSCIPVLIVLFSWFLSKERISLRQGLGVATSLFGVVLIISQGRLDHLLQLQVNGGDLYVMGAAVCWAFYSTNLKRYPKGLHPFAYQTSIVIIGLCILLPIYLVEINSGRTFSPNISTLVTIIYVALFASVLAFLFWNRAIAELGANIAAPFIHLMPVFSTILAVIFLDEKLTANHLVAILFIFSGIVLATYKIKRRVQDH